MEIEVISDTNEHLIRRMILEPGEAMFWHVDVCRSFSVVVRGSQLAIEYQESSETIEVDVSPGMAGWDEPESRPHRAVNVGVDCYEEVVTFYRESLDVDPQPKVAV